MGPGRSSRVPVWPPAEAWRGRGVWAGRVCSRGGRVLAGRAAMARRRQGPWLWLVALAAVLWLAGASGGASEGSVLPPADLLLSSGSEAYGRGDWGGVILQMERALRSREAHRARLVHCRRLCAHDDHPDAAPPAPPAPGARQRRQLHDLRFFRRLLRRAACLRRCLPDGASQYQWGEEAELEFRKRSPYNYLQVAYFKVLAQLSARAELSHQS